MIAIEGLTGAGKTTAARELARRHGIPCFNTGSLYRGAAVASIIERVAPDELQQFLSEASYAIDLSDPSDPLVSVNGIDTSPMLQDPRVTRRSTKIGGIAVVSTRFDGIYQDLLTQPNVIVEGKGLSNGMAAHAENIFYLTATRAVRASRKYKQAITDGKDYTLQQAYADVERGDVRDLGNAGGLLKKSGRSELIDTSSMSVDEVVAEIEHRSGLIA